MLPTDGQNHRFGKVFGNIRDRFGNIIGNMTWQHRSTVKNPSPIDGMNAGASIFLYTPLPYWGIFLLVLYRHDLSRLFHPFKDDGSPIKWWSVLNHMSLLGTAQSARRPRSIRRILPYLVLFAISAVVSLSWTFRLFPPSLLLPNHRPGHLRYHPHGLDHAVSRPASQKAIRRRTQIPAARVEDKAPWEGPSG